MKLIGKGLLSTVLMSAIVLTGCSRSNDENSDELRSDKVKATITVSKEFVKADGYKMSVTATGVTNTTGKFTDWLVNGQRKTGINLELGTDDFAGGKTVTIESTDDVISGLVSIDAFAGATPFTISHKVEKGGKVRSEGTNEQVKMGQDPTFMRSANLND